MIQSSVIKTIPVTQQIVLRQIQMSDSTDIFNTIDSQREYLGKWLPFVAFTHKETDTARFIQTIVEARPDKAEYVFVILYEGAFVGLIGFKDTDQINRKTEIGYWLSEHQQGKGIITQSVKTMCQFAFKELRMNRIQIKCATGNVPSKKVPQRLQFHFEGIERAGELLSSGKYADLEIYSQLVDEFNALPG